MRIIRVRALIENGGELLCVQHHHHKVGIWALPGGRVDENEKLTDAISRELVEELGVKPEIGQIKYIHQLFLANGDESLEFFFEVTNSQDYKHIDIMSTTHGEAEIRKVGFIDPEHERLLPEFLADYKKDQGLSIWPIFKTRIAEAI